MLQKHYLNDLADFEFLSRDWPKGTVKPSSFPCVAVWHWWHGLNSWVDVLYIYQDDLNYSKKSNS